MRFMLVQGFCLPTKYRIEFALPKGVVFTGTPRENASFISQQGFLRNKDIIVVGDVVSETILKSDIKPKIAVIDYRTKRTRRHIAVNREYFTERYKVVNPPGMISLEALSLFKSTLTRRNNQSILVEVLGEEDLLVLPAMMFSPDNTIIIYGQPNWGLVLIEIDPITRKTALNFWALFKPCIKQIHMDEELDINEELKV